MDPPEESVNDRLQGHWLSSHTQDMAVRVHGDMAVVYGLPSRSVGSDGERRPFTIFKNNGSWPEPKSDRGKVALAMIRYVERAIGKKATNELTL